MRCEILRFVLGALALGLMSCSAASDGAQDCGAEIPQAACERCGPPPEYELICPDFSCPMVDPPSRCYPYCSATSCTKCVEAEFGDGWEWIIEAWDCVRSSDLQPPGAASEGGTEP